MMKTKNNTFSFRRVWMLMRWDFGTNWKTYAYRVIGMYCIFLFLLLFERFSCDEEVHLLEGYTYEDALYWSRYFVVREILSRCLVVFFFIHLFIASRFMEQTSTKVQSITFLTLPASNLEKFLYRAFITIVCYLALGFTAFALADLTVYLFVPLMNVNQEIQCTLLSDDFMRYSCVWLFGSCGEIAIPYEGSWMRSWGYLLYSYFILSRCNKRHQPLLMTLGGAAILLVGGFKLGEWLKVGDTLLIASINAVFWLLVVLCCILAYRLFCRRQIV